MEDLDDNGDWGINLTYCCCSECVRQLGELLTGPPQTWDGSKYPTYGDLALKKENQQ